MTLVKVVTSCQYDKS